jgi:hypothetical protein
MHSLLEAYLSELAAHLSALPTKPRVEELREMRAHLENAVAGYRAQGSTDEEAAQAALAQFGPSAEIAAGLTHAWRRGQGSWRDVVKSGLFGVAALWSVTGLCSVLGHYLESHPDVFAMLRLHFEPVFYALLFGLPALLGGLFGRYFAHGAVKGAAWGTGAAYVGPWVMYEVIHAWTDSDILGIGLIVLLQAVCLTGAVWASRRWRESQKRPARG